MMKDVHVPERPLIGDRFSKLEKARVAVTPLAITLANQLKKATASPAEREQMVQAKNEVKERLQKRRNQKPIGRYPNKMNQ